MAGRAEMHTVTDESMRDWLSALKRCWESRDHRLVNMLFSEKCSYFETPFSPPFRDREQVIAYWKDVASQPVTISFECSPISSSDHSLYFKWRALLVSEEKDVEMDGISLAEFDECCQCVHLVDWWHKRESLRPRVHH